MKRYLLVAAALLLAACGDVETWRMSAYRGNTLVSEKYTTSEERCRKHGQASVSVGPASGYVCELVAFQENFPGGEPGARFLAWFIKLLA